MDEDLRNQYREAMRAWSRKGFPQYTAQIREALDTNTALDEETEHDLVVAQKVIPMVDSDTPQYAPAAATPPRSGQGSGKNAWIEFAQLYSDLDEELIETLPKKDLIAMLEVNGVIPEG